MFYSPNDFLRRSRAFGSYGSDQRKKTAKSYAALRHETARENEKK